eukprot:6862474-Pyramimonas_sp.AAC.1
MEIDAPSIAIGIIIGLLTGVFMTVFSVWILWDEIMFFVKQSESEAKYNKEVMYCSDRARPAWLTGFEFGCAVCVLPLEILWLVVPDSFIADSLPGCWWLSRGLRERH